MVRMGYAVWSVFQRMGGWLRRRGNTSFVKKWLSIGVAVVFAGLVTMFLYQGGHGSTLDADAKKEAEVRALKAKQKANNKSIMRRAVKHWNEWRAKFIGDHEVACYHSNNLANYHWPGVKNAAPYYRIQCNIGPKGKPPTTFIVCDQAECKKAGKKKAGKKK